MHYGQFCPNEDQIRALRSTIKHLHSSAANEMHFSNDIARFERIQTFTGGTYNDIMGVVFKDVMSVVYKTLNSILKRGTTFSFKNVFSIRPYIQKFVRTL